jgi:hypothetical protein
MFKRDDQVKYKSEWLKNVAHADALRSKWGTVDYIDDWGITVYWGNAERTRVEPDTIDAV